MTRPKVCTKCSQRVKGHPGPHGNSCGVVLETTIDEEGLDWSGLDEVDFNEMSPEQLRAHIQGLQTSLSSLQAAQKTTTQVNSQNPSVSPVVQHEETQPNQPSHPNGLDRRVEDLASQLVAGNRLQETPAAPAGNWTGSTIRDLRSDRNVTSLADQLLNLVIERAPFLQPQPSVGLPAGPPVSHPAPGGQPGILPAAAAREGIHAGHPGGFAQVGQAQAGLPGGYAQLGQTHAGLPGGFPQQAQAQYFQLPGIYQTTTNPFVKVGNTKLYNEHYPHLYSSESSITQSNINLPHFVLGYLRYLMSGIEGKQNISPEDFKVRLQHLINTMQVAITNSNGSTDYNDYSWAIAREYSNRVFRDLEEGHKAWSTIGVGMQTDAYIFSKDSVKPPQAKPKTGAGQPSKSKPLCRNFNTVSNEGRLCSWEVSNPGKRCYRLHNCSYCFETFNNAREHRDMECEYKKGVATEKDPFCSKGSEE